MKENNQEEQENITSNESTELNQLENEISNESTEIILVEKKSNILLNICLVILIVVALVGGVFAIKKINYQDNKKDDEVVDKKTQDDNKKDDEIVDNKTTESITTKIEDEIVTTKQIEDNKKVDTISVDNKQVILKNKYTDGDYQRYTLKVNDNIGNNEYTVKLGSDRLITIKSSKEFSTGYVLSVNGNTIYDEFISNYYWNTERNNLEWAEGFFEIYMHVFGKYIVFEILDDMGGEQSFYIVGSDNKPASSKIYYYADEKSFSKNGMKLHYITTIDNEELDCEYMLMSDEEKKDTIYSASYVYEYKNGVLDTKGKIEDAVYFSDYYKNNRNYQEEYEYCKENWSKGE